MDERTPLNVKGPMDDMQAEYDLFDQKKKKHKEEEEKKSKMKSWTGGITPYFWSSDFLQPPAFLILASAPVFFAISGVLVSIYWIDYFAGDPDTNRPIGLAGGALGLWTVTSFIVVVSMIHACNLCFRRNVGRDKEDFPILLELPEDADPENPLALYGKRKNDRDSPPFPRCL